jgi:hypothetical protein
MNEEFPKMSVNEAKAFFQASDFQNGLTYYDANKVLNLSRFQNKLYAQVQGSGAATYNVILTFADKLSAKCTCPAARRNPFCKHTAAVLAGWAKNPNAFVMSEGVPELQVSKKKASVKRGQADTGDLIARGVKSVETLITELALAGLSTVTASRVQQVKDLAENLRTYKLRRLSTLLAQFAEVLNGLLADKENFSLAMYAELLADILITAKGVLAIQQGKLPDPKYMEELVGKTWTERELTRRDDLELVEVFFEVKETVDGFKVFSSYFIELKSGDILAEKLIVPKHIKKGPNAEKRSYAGLKLHINEAYQYPGYPPWRIKLKQFAEGSVILQDVETLASKAHADFTKEVEAFRTFKKDFFAPADYYTLLKPNGFYASAQGLSVFDSDGKAFELMLTDRSSLNLEHILESSPLSALFGKIQAVNGSLKFEPLSAVVISQEKPVIVLA